MAIDEVVGQAWTRKHDDPALPVVKSAPRTAYPRSLEELIEPCKSRKPTEKLHAAGSHWALSGAAISDSVFVETHDPNNNHQAMGRTLYDVVGGPFLQNTDSASLRCRNLDPKLNPWHPFANSYDFTMPRRRKPKPPRPPRRGNRIVYDDL